MLLPSNLQTGRVEWRAVADIIDSDDPDTEPDIIPAQGEVWFDAEVSYWPAGTAEGGPLTIVHVQKVGIIDSDGFLCSPDPRDPSKPGPNRFLRLFASNDPDYGVTGWKWKATPRLKDINGRPLIDAVAPKEFYLEAGTTLDLTYIFNKPAPGVSVPILQAEATAIASAASAREAAAAASDALVKAEDAKDAAYRSEQLVAAANARVGADDLQVAGHIQHGTETGAAIAAVLGDKTTPAGKRLTSIFGTNTFMLTPERFPAINNTGTANTTSALQAAFDSLPTGATAVMTGTYRIGTIAINPKKFLTIDMSAAQVITEGANTAFQCFGSFEDQISVSSIEAVTEVVENGENQLTKLTMGQATGWKRGDIVKVIADNQIPAAHVTSETVFPRVGEFATVYSANDNAVLLQGALTEPFITNIRAARLVPGSVSILHPTCDVSDARFAGKVAGNMFRFDSLIAPQVISPRFTRLVGMGLSFKSCYGYYVEDPVSYTGIDNTNIGVLSYSIHDSGCADGVIVGGTLRGGRHGFTDGSADVAAASPNTNDYGASLNFLLEGVTVRDMTASCLDTHHNGRGGRFVNCTTYPQPGQNNYTLRGRDHRIISPTCYGGKSVVGLVGQVTGVWSKGETYGAELVNPRSFGTERIVTAGLRNSANHPFAGIRANNRSLVVQGGYHEGLKRAGLLVNADVRWRGHVELVMGPMAEGAFWEITNSVLQVDDVEVDALGISSISPFGTQRVVYASDDDPVKKSEIQIGRMRLRASAVYRAAAIVPFEALAYTEKFIVDELVFDPSFQLTNPVRVPSGMSKQSVRWRVAANSSDSNAEASSATAVYLNDAVTGDLMRLFRSPDPILQLSAGITDGVPRTLAPLPRGKFVGQMLRVVLTNSTAALTIANGLAANAGLIGSSTKVLAVANDQVTLFWSGSIWRQSREVI